VTADKKPLTTLSFGSNRDTHKYKYYNYHAKMMSNMRKNSKLVPVLYDVSTDGVQIGKEIFVPFQPFSTYMYNKIRPPISLTVQNF
jgi:hypothetical protein